MSITTSSHAVVGTPLRPLRRGRDNAILGGVCGGFATRLGIKERNIRVIFALLTLIFGLGVLLYMTFWLVLTRSGEEHPIIQHDLPESPRGADRAGRLHRHDHSDHHPAVDRHQGVRRLRVATALERLRLLRRMARGLDRRAQSPRGVLQLGAGHRRRLFQEPKGHRSARRRRRRLGRPGTAPTQPHGRRLGIGRFGALRDGGPGRRRARPLRPVVAAERA